MSAFPSGCRAFLQELPTHLVAARSGAAVPHVDGCHSCGEHLAAAVRQDGMLRRVGAPLPPAALRSARFLSAIHERIVADSEASELGRHLERVLVATPAPAAMPWPEQALPESARAIATGAAPAASAELWSVVRRQVFAEIHGRQLRLRRRFFLASAAAAVLLASAVLQFFSPNDGTSEAPEPVLVRVDSPPPGADFISPGLALQEAVLR